MGLLRRIKILCLLVCIFSVTANSSTFNVEIGGDSDIVTFHGASLDGNLVPAFAGNFNGTHVDDGNTVHMYCVDLITSISYGIHEFTQTELSEVHNKYHKAAWLMDTFSLYLDTVQSGAVQLAIWEVIHESSGVFDLYSGTFLVLPFSFSWPFDDFTAEFSAITTSFLTSYDPSADLSQYAVFQNPSVQDTIGEKLEISEPPTVIMLIIAMIALVINRLKNVSV